ncbi:hypothetical protein L1889_03755 [Paenalcaligenes niemegkensis]|uniref:hypothetical protein n=1 Tax=Paenalcaligenes niemegkensis TaxID=2895469 RepID=UPI001EE8EA87|nr:hypothetical protein [Paenalcaligenes niemegkensis]MCQ9615925.1 hypothetical protein [Paenalcaligenes niemegkensis]
MRGQTEIIQLRLSGYKPLLVWVFVLQIPCRTDFFWDAESSIELNGMPEIHIGVDDSIAGLDFRFLYDVTVLLQGVDIDRLRAAFRRIRQFSPRRIVTSTPTMLNDTKEMQCIAA